MDQPACQYAPQPQDSRRQVVTAAEHAAKIRKSASPVVAALAELEMAINAAMEEATAIERKIDAILSPGRAPESADGTGSKSRGTSALAEKLSLTRVAVDQITTRLANMRIRIEL